MIENQDLTVHTLWEDILKVLRRRKMLVVCTAVATLIAVYVGLLFVGDKYEADASLLVTLGRENAEVPLTVERGTVHSDGVRKEEVNSYISLLTSRPLIAAAVEQVGLERFKDHRPPPQTIFGKLKAAGKSAYHWLREEGDEILIALNLRPRLSEAEKAKILVQKALNVYREKDASVINLSLRLADPVLARDLLDALVSKYMEAHTKVVRSESTLVSVFEQQATEYGKALADLRDHASKVKAQFGVTSVQDQKSRLQDILKAAESSRMDNERELARLKAAQNAMIARLSQVPPQVVATVVATPSVTQSKARELLASLSLKLSQTVAKYETNAEPIALLEQEIASVRSLTNGVPSEDDGPKTYMRNPVTAHFDLQLEDDKIKIEGLEASIAAAERQVLQMKMELARLDQAETELQRLNLEINVTEARYVANASKREEAKTSRTMDRARLANVSILSAPSFDEKPVAPKRLLIVGLGLVVGLMAGLALGLFLEWRNDVIYDPQDLEKLVAGSYLGTYSLS